MNFIKGKVKELYLFSTDVENIFINEYMPSAPGDYVKVYLYGLLYAQAREQISEEVIRKQLKMTKGMIGKAWDYWQEMGVIRKIPKKNSDTEEAYDIEYIPLRVLMYGNSTDEIAEAEEKKDDLCNQDTKKLLEALEQLTGKIFSPKELKTIISWEKDCGATNEVILSAFDYCYQRQKTSVNYIEKVVLQWTENGLRTTKDVEEHLKVIGERQSEYKKILQSLGMNRGATEAEKKLIDTWIDEMKFDLTRILEACDRTISTPSPNLRYVNKVLENWKTEAQSSGRDVNQKVTVTQATLNRYYEYLREESERKAEKRKNQVYSSIPRIAEIDMNLNKLSSEISMGLLSGMEKTEGEKLRKLIDLLETERAVLLTENNLPIDYTDIHYFCEKCSDTGLDESGQKCSCISERIGEAELWQNAKEKTK